MESVDLIVLKSLLRWRQAGQAALLVTVVQTWGSSPRPPGSLMALSESGAVVGSVSGGCIEDDLIDQHVGPKTASWHGRQGVERLVYGIAADEAHRFGLPCGGTLELVAEYNPDAATLAELIDQLERGCLVQRHLGLGSGAVTLVPTATTSGLTITDTTMSMTFGPGYRMLLIGAGQLAEYLATMAIFSGFSVTLCDPRDEYVRGVTMEGVHVTRDMPDDAVISFKPDSRSCIVALSHDPKLDDMALLEALHSEAFYVGAIGSRRNQAARRARMIDFLEQTEAIMDRVHGPVGLYIGSKTPAEIAVSIMAEIIAVKNGVDLPPALDIQTVKQGVSA